MQSKLVSRLKEEGLSPLALLRDDILTSTVDCFDKVTRDIHTPEALLHTSQSIKGRFADFFISKRKIILQLLCQAADAGEISRSKATEEVALALIMATSCFYPPYLDNYSESITITSRDDLIKRVPVLVDLLISGLRS
jgi:hypothetical protein